MVPLVASPHAFETLAALVLAWNTHTHHTWLYSSSPSNAVGEIRGSSWMLATALGASDACRGDPTHRAKGDDTVPIAWCACADPVNGVWASRRRRRRRRARR